MKVLIVLQLTTGGRRQRVQQSIKYCGVRRDGRNMHGFGPWNLNKNSSGDEIANVNFFYNIAHVEASAYAH